MITLKNSNENSNSSEKKISEFEEPIIGIDLGTTFSCVGIIRNGNVEIIPESNTGNRIIPSVICYTNDNPSETLIGGGARNHMIEFAKSIMYESKRLIGRKFLNKNVQKDISYWPLKIVENKNNGKPQYVIEKDGKEEKYYPEEVSSILLKYLKEQAEIYENKKINKAIITVPAHFNNLQRNATIKAAKDAQLNVIQIINEPTAAAIAYGNIHKSNKERKILIFDLGGGTFDVSILKIKNNEYTVLASQGEEHLGGEDFTQRLFNYVKSEILKKDNFKNINFKQDDENTISSVQDLMNATEKVKKELSTKNKSSLFLRNLFGISDFKIIIERKKYEELCKDYWEKILNKLNEIINYAKISKDNIDEVILVGGSSRTPKIQEIVKNYFGKEPLRDINPDEVVAYGATLLTNRNNNLKIKDISFNNIGISVKGKLSVIIPKGTILPLRGNNLLKYEKEYYIKGNNEEILIRIFEGNNEKISDNNYLGEFKIKLNGKDEIVSISMMLDYNSILNVEATNNGEKKNEIKIKINMNDS